MKESSSNDSRQKLVQDMINGARTIKCYGWEQHYIDNIAQCRKKQVPYIISFQFVQFMGVSVYQNGGLIVIIAIMAGLYHSEQKLDEAISMSLLAMVFFIFLSVNMMFYYSMTTLLAFLAIVNRISSIFEMEEYASERSLEGGDKAMIKFENCDFSWGFRVSEQRADDKAASPTKKGEGSAEKKKEAETTDPKKDDKKPAPAAGPIDKFKTKTEKFDKNVLTGIDFELKKGDFLAVIGQVGCGKSSLLLSIMDETVLKKGNKSINGSLAYVEQEPFIFSGSVKENILFGKEFDAQLFDKAVRAS